MTIMRGLLTIKMKQTVENSVVGVLIGCLINKNIKIRTYLLDIV